MSAIWGAINLTGVQPPDTAERMKKGFRECVIDRWEYLETEGIAMGCGIQYVTKYAVGEQLPYSEGERYLNADVVLDNRSDLFKRLGEPEDDKVPDGKLLRKVYERFGDECLNELLGAYVFVCYDRVSKKAELLADAVGERFVYYTLQDGVLYYASLMNPLKSFLKKCSPNERWLSDYIGQDNFGVFTESEETPVDGIYRIVPAGKLTFTVQANGQIQVDKKKYWNPYHVAPLRLNSDEAYKNKFLEIYRECVKSKLCSSGETAILLSGGYDSSSVACLAAKELAAQGKKLYSYTSVPLKDYQSEFGGKMIVDESPAVKLLKEHYPNLECTFMDLPDMDVWAEHEEYMKVCEMPYKSPQNLLWIYRGMQLAYEQGARVILTGTMGNATVSFGNLPLYLVYLFRHGRFWEMWRQIQCLYEKRRFSRKGMLAATVYRGFKRMPYPVTEESCFSHGFVQREYLHRQGADRRLKKLAEKMCRAGNDYKLSFDLLFCEDDFRHMGEFKQKNSLYTGVMDRDPTLDKRMIAFVRAIPYEQFNKDACSRRLIAEYMKGIVPKEILEEKRKGRQSADLRRRWGKDADKVCAEWINRYERHKGDSRIDCDKALRELKGKKMKDLEREDIIRHFYTNLFLEYMDRWQDFDGI